MHPDIELLRSIRTFTQLLKYLRDELDWPIESDNFEDLTFDYEPEELGIDAKTAVKIKEIKQLHPLTSRQPWGIFFINFEPKQLPIVVLRDFGKRTMQEDPVIHFYELFLKEYDKKKKVERGVFYTPQPVVSYIVRSVHELLQKEFGLEDGLASTITWGEMAKRFANKTSTPSFPLVGNLTADGPKKDSGQAGMTDKKMDSRRSLPSNVIVEGGNDGTSAPVVEKVSYSDNTVWIDKAKTQGFHGVPENVWNFHIGGYQVCQKWLKDRKGRTLSTDDINHYHRIVVALNETIRIMAEIDKVIEQHGGWPGAFQDKKEYPVQPEPLQKVAEGKEEYNRAGLKPVSTETTQ